MNSRSSGRAVGEVSCKVLQELSANVKASNCFQRCATAFTKPQVPKACGNNLQAANSSSLQFCATDAKGKSFGDSCLS